jgi:hypothetical protein
MTLLQLKKVVDKVSKQDRCVLSAYLWHLSRKDDPDYHEEMETSSRKSAKSETFSLNQVKQMHRDLVKMGL